MASVDVEAPAPPGPPPPPDPPAPPRRFPDLDRPGRVDVRRAAVAPTVMAALFLFAVFASRFSFLGILAFGAGLGVFAVRAVTRGRIDRIGLWALACLAFTAASGIAVGAAPGRADLATFMGQDGRVFVAYVPFLVFATMTTTRVHVDRLRTILRALVLLTPVTWVVTSMGLLPSYRRHGAFVGLTSSHHAMGMLMGVVGLTLLLAPGRRRALDQVCGAAALGMIVVVGSRTSMTGVLVAALYLFFRTPSVVQRLRMVVVLLVAVVVVLAVSGRTASTVAFLTSPEFIDAAATELANPETVEDGEAQVDSGPTSGAEISNVLLRFGLWRTAADEWVRSPVVGIGAWRFNDPYRTYVGVPGLQLATDGEAVHDGFGAHNLVLQTLAETGIVGLALLLSPWLALARRVRRGRLPRPEHTAVIAVLLFAVGTTLTSNSLISPALTFPVLAVVMTLVRQRGTGPLPAVRATAAASAPTRAWWVGAAERRAASTSARRGGTTAVAPVDAAATGRTDGPRTDGPRTGGPRVDGPPPPAPGTVPARAEVGPGAGAASAAHRELAVDPTARVAPPAPTPWARAVGAAVPALDAAAWAGPGPEGTLRSTPGALAGDLAPPHDGGRPPVEGAGGGDPAGRFGRARRNLGVLVLRVGAAGVQLVAVVAVGRALGALVLGQYLVFQAVVRVGATALAWGHPWTVLRAIAVNDARGDRAASRSALSTGLRGVAMGSTVVAVAVAALAAVAWAWGAAPIDVDPAVVVAAAVALVALAFALVAANALKARDRQGSGLVVEFAPQPLAACAVATLAMATGWEADMGVLGAAMAAAGALAAASGVWLWRRDDVRRSPSGAVTDLALDDGRDDRGRAAFGLTNLANVVGQNALPLLLPLVMAIDDVGRLGAALRLTAIPGTIGSGLVSVYAPRFAREWAGGLRRRLAGSLRETQMWMLALYAPFGVVFVLVPEALVSLLGPEFEGTATAIRILGVGQAVSAFAGTGVVFLSMCRQERFALAATTLAVVAGSAVALVGGSGWGITGASFGYAVVLGATNVATLVWAHVGVLRRMPVLPPATVPPAAVSRP